MRCKPGAALQASKATSRKPKPSKLAKAQQARRRRALPRRMRAQAPALRVCLCRASPEGDKQARHRVPPGAATPKDNRNKTKGPGRTSERPPNQGRPRASGPSAHPPDMRSRHVATGTLNVSRIGRPPKGDRGLAAQAPARPTYVHGFGFVATPFRLTLDTAATGGTACRRGQHVSPERIRDACARTQEV